MLNGPCGGAGRGQPAITVAGVTFSITIVALTLASQQFGPRLLRNFLRDLGNQVVLAVLSLGVLIFFIDHVATSTQASRIIPNVAADLEGAINRVVRSSDPAMPAVSRGVRARGATSADR